MEAERGFAREIQCLRDCEVRLAGWLARIDRKKVYAHSGCSSAVDYAVRHGVDRLRAVELLRLARTLDAVPQAQEDVREGRVTSQAAAELGKLFSSSHVAPSSADARAWLDRAKTVPLVQLRREVRVEIEEAAQQDRVVSISFAVKESVRDAFRRAKTVASRKADTVLTHGQTLAAITMDYLERHDPLRKKRRARRVGPTRERPGDRYVPAAVEADVLERSDDRCEFPGCGNLVFMELAHIDGHRNDGDREVSNLLRLCSTHHTLMDANEIGFLGFAADGAEFVIVRTGEIVSEPSLPADGRRARPPPGQVSESCPGYRTRRPAAGLPIRRARRVPCGRFDPRTTCPPDAVSYARSTPPTDVPSASTTRATHASASSPVSVRSGARSSMRKATLLLPAGTWSPR